MNLKEITKTIRAQIEKLQQGNAPEKKFAQELASIAAKMEAHQKANERPITDETLKHIHVPEPAPGFRRPKFTPRRLP